MSSTDFPTLFVQPDPRDPFRQGVILTFNASTGANTVRVGGAVLTDLPILVGGDTVNFAPGDVVFLAKYASSWAIFGRIVTPGSEQLTAAAINTAVGEGGTVNFGLSTTPANLVTVNIPVPAWAGRALVLANSRMTVSTPVSGKVVSLATVINGTVSSTTSQDADTQGFFTANHAYARDFTFTPGSLANVPVAAQASATSAVGASLFNSVSISASAIFRKA